MMGHGRGVSSNRNKDWRLFAPLPLMRHGRSMSPDEVARLDAEALKAKVKRWSRRFEQLPEAEQRAVLVALSNIAARSAKKRGKDEI